MQSGIVRTSVGRYTELQFGAHKARSAGQYPPTQKGLRFADLARVLFPARQRTQSPEANMGHRFLPLFWSVHIPTHQLDYFGWRTAIVSIIAHTPQALRCFLTFCVMASTRAVPLLVWARTRRH